MRYADHRYGILFYSLLLSLVAGPALKPLGFGGQVMEAFLAANLVAAVLAVSERGWRVAAAALAAAVVLVRPLMAWLGERSLSQGSLLAWTVLAALAIGGALRFALLGREAGREQVYAALSAYLLAGLFFGLAYWTLEQLAPPSLSTAGTDGLPMPTAIYFSFVTLASLGYGDVLPLSDPARGLAVIEVVGGQLFLAVLVARLVGTWR